MSNRFRNFDPALIETVGGVIEDLKTLHIGSQALVELLGERDWQRMREGVGKLRALLDDLDLNLQTLENGKCDRQ